MALQRLGSFCWNALKAKGIWPGCDTCLCLLRAGAALFAAFPSSELSHGELSLSQGSGQALPGLQRFPGSQGWAVPAQDTRDGLSPPGMDLGLSKGAVFAGGS